MQIIRLFILSCSHIALSLRQVKSTNRPRPAGFSQKFSARFRKGHPLPCKLARGVRQAFGGSQNLPRQVRHVFGGSQNLPRGVRHVFGGSQKQRAECGKYLRKFPQATPTCGTLAEVSASSLKCAGHLRNFPQASRKCAGRLRKFPQAHSSVRDVCGTFRKLLASVRGVCGSFRKLTQACGTFAGLSASSLKCADVCGSFRKHSSIFSETIAPSPKIKAGNPQSIPANFPLLAMETKGYFRASSILSFNLSMVPKPVCS